MKRGGVMAQNITADNILDYFFENIEALSKQYRMVASNEEQGVEVYMAEENGFPCFSVEVDGEEVYAVETCSYSEAEVTYEELYAMYVYPEMDYESTESDDDDRRNEIDGAVEDLLAVLIDGDPYKEGLSQCDIDIIASLVEQYLFDQYGISVRHPTEVGGVVIQYPFGIPEDEDEIVFGS